MVGGACRIIHAKASLCLCEYTVPNAKACCPIVHGEASISLKRGPYTCNQLGITTGDAVAWNLQEVCV
jgi:hypothetical protein